MRAFLYAVVGAIARIHTKLMSINDINSYGFTDKELHFLVIGILGMILVLAILPIFTALAKHDHILAITFIYVFTLIIVITFAIEIGQKITGTGNMEFADIMFGVVGFLFLFIIFAVIWVIVRAVTRSARKGKKEQKRRR